MVRNESAASSVDSNNLCYSSRQSSLYTACTDGVYWRGLEVSPFSKNSAAV